MRSIDLLSIAGALIIGGCSMQSAQKAVLAQGTDACHREIAEQIGRMTGLSDLKLPKDLFTRSSMLVLSNHPRSSMPIDDPMVGVRGSEKIFRLTRREGACILTLLDETGRSLRSAKLSKCRCKGVQER